MRPRSRLFTKKHLPTIREGYEELLQDMNQANSYHAPHHTHQDALSSEDYLRSICQLARPTFPLQEPDRDILTLGPLEALKPGLRLVRLSAPTRSSTPIARSYSHQEEQMRDRAGLHNFSDITALDAMGPNRGGDGCHSAPNPLEYLYGHWDTPASSTCLSRDTKGRLSEGGVSGEARLGSNSLPRANSFPLLCSPFQAYRKSSCPEISLEDTPSPNPSPPQPCSLKEKKSSTPRLPNQRPQEGTGSRATTGEGENCGDSTDKHSMISNWITDCRSAWHETKIRACMLPTIAEI